MNVLEVRLGRRSYPIYIGAGLLDQPDLLRRAIPGRQTLIVTNDVVAPLYLERLERALDDRAVETCVLPDGEQHKTLATFSAVLDRLMEAGFHRDASIAALGGGVVGDLAGFAAACYQRGIDYVQVPTTLLAQVDSSVGGKTAVNHSRGKNMIGAFHQPVAVIADTSTLGTLPPRQLSAGLAEVVKYGLILDRALFEWLEKRVEALLALEPEALEWAITRSCELKADVVEEDEREHGNRALLNLGHTFGHALESSSGYGKWLHGEAVAIGTVLAARTSQQLGWLSREDRERIESLLSRARLPVNAPGTDPDIVLEHMKMDKKAGKQGLKLVLLEAIGRAVVTEAPQPSLLRDVTAAGLEGR